MADIKRLNLLLGVIAVVILATSCAVFAYTLTPQGDADKVVVNGMDFAWEDIASNYEIGQNVATDCTPEKVTIRATNVFRKENGSWKMIGHHTDLLPFLEK